MKSKIEIKLNKILSDNFVVKYEPLILYGKSYSLKVDFKIITPNNEVFYLEYSGMNFFKKYYKIIDIAKHNVNFYVIFDDENLSTELDIFYSLDPNLSQITLNKTMKRIENFNNIINQLLNE